VIAANIYITFYFTVEATVTKSYVLLLLFFFILMTPRGLIIWGCTKLIFTKFSGLVDLWLEVMDLTFVLHLLKGICYDKQFLGRIDEISLPHLHLAHRLEDHNASRRVNSGNHPSTSIKNLVSVGVYEATRIYTLGVHQLLSKFHNCSLGSGTVRPGGLHASLCHTFLVV